VREAAIRSSIAVFLAFRIHAKRGNNMR